MNLEQKTLDLEYLEHLVNSWFVSNNSSYISIEKELRIKAQEYLEKYNETYFYSLARRN